MSFLFAPASASASSTPPPVGLSTLLQPPSLEQLAARTAVASTGRGVGRKGKNMKNGKIVAKFYNTLGPRPFPRIGSLEQSIRVTFEYSTSFSTTSTTVPTFSSSYFVLSSFPSAANYTNLFDQYRFELVEVWVEPRTPQGTTTFSTFTTAVDLDDANTPTSVGDVAAKQGAIIGDGGAGRYHRWQPHMAVATFSGAFTSYANEPASWIDSASPNVQHFGFKAAFSSTPSAISYNLDVRATVTFRAPGL